MIGPTQRGKTTLCRQCLHEVISPARKATILAGKPPARDPGMTHAGKSLGLRVVHEWPPPPTMKFWRRDQESNGYLLRPKHDMEHPERTDDILASQFGPALKQNYASKKPNIVVVDEGHHVSNDLGQKKNMDNILMRGAPVVSLWVLVQRGRFMSYQVYDAPEWIFIAQDPDMSNVRRYAEVVGGVDPKQVSEIVANLKTYTVKNHTGKGTISEFLVIQRSGNQIAIVDVA